MRSIARIAATLALLASSAACTTDEDGCYIRPPGAPDIEILEAEWTSANCTKSYSYFQGAELATPGAHAFGTDPDWMGNWAGCENAMTAEAEIDEAGMSLDYQIDIVAPFVPDRPPTPGNPNPGPDPMLLQPRRTNVVQWFVFRPHVPALITMDAHATLEGEAAEIFGNFLSMQIDETPVRLGGMGLPGRDAPESFHEQIYRDPMPTPNFRFTPSVSIPPTTYQLEAGVTYRAIVVAWADGYRSTENWNRDTDITIAGNAAFTLEPQPDQACGR